MKNIDIANLIGEAAGQAAARVSAAVAIAVKHYGPGPHPSGSGQEVHGGGGGGVAATREKIISSARISGSGGAISATIKLPPSPGNRAGEILTVSARTRARLDEVLNVIATSAAMHAELDNLSGDDWRSAYQAAEDYDVLHNDILGRIGGEL